MITPKELKRLNQLDEIATRKYLDKTDFDPCEWLDEGDQMEWLQLMRKAEQS